MFTSWLASFAVIGTLVGSALADFAITSPSADAWWGKYAIEMLLLSPNLMHYVPKLPVPRTLLPGLAVTTPLLPRVVNICFCGCCFLFFHPFFVGIFSPTLCRLQVEQHKPQSLSRTGCYPRKHSQCRLLRAD